MELDCYFLCSILYLSFCGGVFYVCLFSSVLWWETSADSSAVTYFTVVAAFAAVAIVDFFAGVYAVSEYAVLVDF